MKQIFIILFLLINLNGFSQITFTGVKKSTNITNNEEKKEVDKKELDTTSETTEELAPAKIPTRVIQNKESSTYNGKITINVYDPEKDIKIVEDEIQSEEPSLNITSEPIEKNIISEEKIIDVEKTNPITISEENNITKNIELDKKENETKSIFLNSPEETTTITNTTKKVETTNIAAKEPKTTKVITSNIVGVEKKSTTIVKKDISVEPFEEKNVTIDEPVVNQPVISVEEPNTNTTTTNPTTSNRNKLNNNIESTTKNTVKTIEVEEPVISVEKETPNKVFETKTIKRTQPTEESIEITEEPLEFETTTNAIELEEPSIETEKTTPVVESEVKTIAKTQNISSPSISTEEPKTIEPETKTSGIFFETAPRNEENNTVDLEKTKVSTQKSETKPNTNNRQNLTNIPEKTENEKEESKPSNPKKGSWSIGIGAGLPVVLGDMSTRFGYGANLNIQKAFGHVFSLRFQAIYLETFGRDNDLYENTYSNYKTRFSDYTLQGVFTLNNLNFYKKEPKVIYNLIAGGGLATRHSWIDNFDENATLYSYDNIPNGDRKETAKALNDLLDKNYETIVAKDQESMSIKNTNILPSLVLGAGISVKLSKVIDLNIETRMSYHFDDNLDAHQRGTKNDWMSYTSLGLTFKIPSKNESMMWTNPVYSATEEIEDLKKKVDEGDLLKDEDKDGIADIFDQDLNTPAKVAVDSRGIPADMDQDGVPDYKDAEPFTTIGAAVDANGVAIDSDNDGVPDIIDIENNTIAGKQVDSKGRTINTAADLANLENNSDFDLIFFEENSSKVKKEFYSDLYKISKHITKDPTAIIQIIGHTDVLASEKYNLELSEKRANAVYSLLIEVFKVPSKNLETKYFGEQKPLIENLPENKATELAPAYYLNRRVEFKILK